jgi:hypothetical protein
LGQELVGQLQGGVEAGALAMPQRVGCNCQVPPSKEPDLFWPRLARLAPRGARTPFSCFENLIFFLSEKGMADKVRSEDTHRDTHTRADTRPRAHTHSTYPHTHTHTRTPQMLPRGRAP